MQFFDAHCDTVMKAMDHGLDFLAGGPSHLDLPRLLEAGMCVQIFAIFTSQGYYPDDGDCAETAEAALDTIHGWAAASDGRLRLALTAADIRAACTPWEAQDGKPERPVYGLIGLEGADPLGDRAENLVPLFEQGVRHVIAAWDDNAFSGTVVGEKGPLTPEGARLIELCEALHVMVDVSHLSDTAFWQVCDIAARPFVASHSNCRALCPHLRNLTDEMIRTLAGRGGVMGLNMAAYFLEPVYRAQWDAIEAPYKVQLRATTSRDARREIRARCEADLAKTPRPDVSWAVRHILHAIQVGGEDCMGLGGDLDGVLCLPLGLTGVESYPFLAASLRAAGLTERQVEKVCWQNMARVYDAVLP